MEPFINTDTNNWVKTVQNFRTPSTSLFLMFLFKPSGFNDFKSYNAVRVNFTIIIGKIKCKKLKHTLSLNVIELPQGFIYDNLCP